MFILKEKSNEPKVSLIVIEYFSCGNLPPKLLAHVHIVGLEKTDTHYMWMAQNNAVPEACDCAKKWVSIGLMTVWLTHSYIASFTNNNLTSCRNCTSNQQALPVTASGPSLEGGLLRPDARRGSLPGPRLGPAHPILRHPTPAAQTHHAQQRHAHAASSAAGALSRHAPALTWSLWDQQRGCLRSVKINPSITIACGVCGNCVESLWIETVRKCGASSWKPYNVGEKTFFSLADLNSPDSKL